MYNILIALGAGALTTLLTAQLVGYLPAVLPALLVTGIALYFLARRTSAQVQAEIEGIVPLLQARQIEAAKGKLKAVQTKYSRWQILLNGQLQAQMGLIDYLQLKFDIALPQLQKGRFQNWTAQMCIGCIHYRNGDKEAAFKEISAASRTAPKESIVFLTWATLLTRDGKRAEALQALDDGLQNMPDSQHLKALRKRIANKKKVDIKQFPETWYQFFPEDMAKQMVMRGTRGKQQQMPQPKMGIRRAPRR